MKLKFPPAGKVSVVVVDQQNKTVDSHVASEPDDLWAWMQKTDPEASAESTHVLGIPSKDWHRVADRLEENGYVYVETEFDYVLVFARHFR